MLKPTCNELYNNHEDFVVVKRESDNSWRHGCYMYVIYKRLSDETYWCASYCLSTDHETNGLREGNADIFQMEPYEITIIDYRPVNFENKG